MSVINGLICLAEGSFQATTPACSPLKNVLVSAPETAANIRVHLHLHGRFGTHVNKSRLNHTFTPQSCSGDPDISHAFSFFSFFFLVIVIALPPWNLSWGKSGALPVHRSAEAGSLVTVRAVLSAPRLYARPRELGYFAAKTRRSFGQVTEQKHNTQYVFTKVWSRVLDFFFCFLRLSLTLFGLRSGFHLLFTALKRADFPLSVFSQLSKLLQPHWPDRFGVGVSERGGGGRGSQLHALT